MTAKAPALRLGPLPRTETIKLTVTLSSELKAVLDDYAAAHSRVHGEAVDATTLIPHMLAAFVARDRGFKALVAKRAAGKPQAAAP